MDTFMKDIKIAKNKYIVELKREKITKDVLRGVVLEYSSQYIVIAVLDDNFYFNGYCLVRQEDVTSYRIHSDDSSFIYNAQIALRLVPKYEFKIELSRLDSFCQTIRSEFPLITVYKKGSDDIIYIGKITKITRNTLSLYEIDSSAEWDKEYSFQFKNISRLDWGGGYERALWATCKNKIDF